MLSYTDLAVDIAEADAYALARGWTDWTGSDPAKTAALRRGQDFIAGQYNTRWASEWEYDAAPENVKFAIIEAARRELAEAGSLSPDRERGGAIKRIKAGSVELEYADGASAATTYETIDGLLSTLLMQASGASVDLLRV